MGAGATESGSVKLLTALTAGITTILVAFCLLGMPLSCARFTGISNPPGWPAVFGGPRAFCAPLWLSANEAGEVYCAGVYSGKVDFDSGADVEACSRQYEDVTPFIVKYGPSGAFEWLLCDVPGLQDASLNDLSIDSLGNVILAGYSTREPYVGEDSTSQLTNEGTVLSLDSGGNLLWSLALGELGNPGGDCEVQAVRVNAEGDIVLAGVFSGTVDFDPSDAAAYASSRGMVNAFLCKISASRDLVWVRTWGGTGIRDKPFSLTFDSFGSIYVTGTLNGFEQLVFDSGQVLPEAATGSLVGSFLMKFDENGVLIWMDTWAGDCIDDKCYSRSLVSFGDRIYTYGDFEGNLRFVCNEASTEAISHGLRDNFLMEFGTDGACEWAVTWGNEGDEKAQSLAVSDTGRLYCCSSAVVPAGDLRKAAVYYVARDTAPVPIWEAQCYGTDIAWDTQLGLCMSGYFTSPTDLGRGAGAVMTNTGAADGYIVRVWQEDALDRRGGQNGY